MAAGVWITRTDPGAGLARRMAVKDLFDTAGVRTTYGSAVFARNVPERTAAAVRLLEAGGWVSAGKANLHEFAFGITSQNPHYGTAPNPRYPARTAGGSSGGSAAAVALGEAELGLGTDSGGSLRIPPACCGLTGFKPSFGLVPPAGCFPLAPSFDHVGPLAADVAGCAAAMRALAGVEPLEVGLGELRIGVAWLEAATPAVRDRVAAALGPLGAEPAGVPLPHGVFPAFQAEIAVVHRELFARHRELYGRNVATKIVACLAVSDEAARAARAERERYRDAFASALEPFDLLLAPTLPIVPPARGVDELEVRARMTQLTFPLNVTGAPALALPCGETAAGLPVSLQVIGAPGADALVLAAGAASEAALERA